MDHEGSSQESRRDTESVLPSNETVGLQARLLLGEKGLAVDTNENTHVVKTDLSADNIAYTHIDAVLAKATNDQWQNTEPALRKTVWVDAMQKRFAEYEGFWQGDKGKAWTETFKKIGFDPTNISTDTTAINSLYMQVRPASGESPTKRFVDTIINAYTVDGSVQYDKLHADKEALNWIGHTLDATDLDIIGVITEARVNMQKNPDALVSAVNHTEQRDGKIVTRIGALTQKEAAILAKFQITPLVTEQPVTSRVAVASSADASASETGTTTKKDAPVSAEATVIETAHSAVETPPVSSPDPIAILQHEAEKTPIAAVIEPAVPVSEHAQPSVDVNHTEAQSSLKETDQLLYDVILPPDAKEKKEALKKQIDGLKLCYTFFDSIKEAEESRVGVFGFLVEPYKSVRYSWAKGYIDEIGKRWNIKGSTDTIVAEGTPRAWDTIAGDLQAMIERGEVDSYFPKQGLLDAWGIGKEDKDRPRKIKEWEEKVRKAREVNQPIDIRDLTTVGDMINIKKQQLKKAA